MLLLLLRWFGSARYCFIVCTVTAAFGLVGDLSGEGSGGAHLGRVHLGRIPRGKMVDYGSVCDCLIVLFLKPV